MTKVELIAAVAANAGLTKKDAEKAVTATIDVITETLQKGRRPLVGFGTFEVRERKEHQGRDPPDPRAHDHSGFQAACVQRRQGSEGCREVRAPRLCPPHSGGLRLSKIVAVGGHVPTTATPPGKFCGKLCARSFAPSARFGVKFCGRRGYTRGNRRVRQLPCAAVASCAACRVPRHAVPAFRRAFLVPPPMKGILCAWINT